MLTIIYFTTAIAVSILFAGFLEIKIPFLKPEMDQRVNRRLNIKVARKIIKRKMGYDRLHKGFINVYDPHHHPRAA